MMKKIFLILVMMCFAAYGVLGAECLSDLSNYPCDVSGDLTLDGGAYSLLETLGNEVAISITGDDLTLDCNNSILTGNTSEYQKVISGGNDRNNVVIENCNIDNSNQGIHFSNGTTNLIIRNNNINSTAHMIHFSETNGYAENISIVGNSFYHLNPGGGSGVAIHPYDDDETYVGNLNFSNNNYNGGSTVWYIGGATDSYFTNNVVLSGDNFYTGGTTDNILVSGNEFSGTLLTSAFNIGIATADDRSTTNFVVENNDFNEVFILIGDQGTYANDVEATIRNNNFNSAISIIFMDVNATDVDIYGNNITGTQDLTGLAGIPGGSILAQFGLSYSANIYLTDVEIYDNYIEGMTLFSGAGATNSKITKLKFYDNYVNQNYITNHLGFFIEDFDVVENTVNISNNQFWNGTYTDVAYTKVDNLVIERNTMTNISRAIASTTSTGDNDNNIQIDYNTIEAVEPVHLGYIDNTNIENNNITLVGSGNNGAIYIDSETYDILIRGNNFIGNGEDVAITLDGVHSTTTLSHNNFDNFDGHGVLISGVANTFYLNNNDFINFPYTGNDKCIQSIVDGSQNFYINDNLFRNCTNAVELNYVTDLVSSGNTFESLSWAYIFRGVDTANLFGNDLSNLNNGVMLGDSTTDPANSNINIYSNTFDTMSYGVRTNTGTNNLNIYSNTFDSIVYAVRTNSTSIVNVSGNRMDDTTVGVYAVSSTGVIVENNDFQKLSGAAYFYATQDTSNSFLSGNNVNQTTGTILEFLGSSNNNQVTNTEFRFYNCSDESNYILDSGLANNYDFDCNNYDITGFPKFEFLTSTETIDKGVVTYLDLYWDDPIGTYSINVEYFDGTSWNIFENVSEPYQIDLSVYDPGSHEMRVYAVNGEQITMLYDIDIILEQNYVDDPGDTDFEEVNSSINTTINPTVTNTNAKVTLSLSEAQGSGIVATAKYTSRPLVVEESEVEASFIDVFVSAGITGNVTIEMVYDEPTFPSVAVTENDLRLFAWYDGQWNLGTNQQIDTATNTISAKFPADKLDGSPIMTGYKGGVYYDEDDTEKIIFDGVGTLFVKILKYLGVIVLVILIVWGLSKLGKPGRK